MSERISQVVFGICVGVIFAGVFVLFVKPLKPAPKCCPCSCQQAFLEPSRN